MTRISKQSEKRARCPKKRKGTSLKTGTKKDNLTSGFKGHENAVSSEYAFIAKVK